MRAGDEEFARRVGQIHGYIGPMYRRSRGVMEFCYTIIKESFTDDDGVVHRSAAKTRPRVRVLAGLPDEAAILHALDAEMEEEYPRNRYVQIGFEEDYFFIDMPVGSLFTDEAEEISASLGGFRRASENPVTPMSAEHVRDFDPLQKFYLYGEELQAAEDVAGIFFGVWRLPETERLYVSSHSSSGKAWERGEPFE